MPFLPDPSVLAHLARESREARKVISSLFKKRKIACSFFIGGSFAKGTLLAKKSYDIDLFVRCTALTPEMIDLMERALRTVYPQTLRVHGSRDYFQIALSTVLILEVVPVTYITKPRQMENVTDLSYFHVSYVKKKLSPAMKEEVGKAKAFCVSGGMYGAESYINGFSGYALECLIIQYKTFRQMLQKLSRVDKQLIIDPAKHYRSTGELVRTMNESRRMGPLVIIDPTWKERNVAAAVSPEQFARFQQRARAYLAKPSERFFEEEPFMVERVEKKAKKLNAHFLTVSLETEKQAGDIAGTKLKKFHRLLAVRLAQRYTMQEQIFRYEQGQTSVSYFILKEKVVVQRGPLLSMKKHAQAFKKAHPTARVAKDRYLLTLPVVSPASYLRTFISDNLQKAMDISRIQIS
jgi:tRNA nucleotidyltransferase (CCA-adding enzyme)